MTVNQIPSFYGSRRVRDSLLSPTQPDLIDPVRNLTRLNSDPVLSGVLQFNGDGIIGIACPAVDSYRMYIQPIPQPDASPSGPDLIIHLQPYRIGITAVYVAFTP